MKSTIKILLIIMFTLFAIMMLPIAIIKGLYAGTIGYIKKVYKVIKDWAVKN